MRGRGKGGKGGGSKHATHTAFEFLRFNVVSSGTHNNVPAYLAGRKYSELPGDWPRAVPEAAEWILETAARNGFVTSFVDGEFVTSKSSIPRVRLKTFELYDTAPDVSSRAFLEAMKFAHHVVHPIFDAVLPLMAHKASSFGVPSPRLCFGGQSIFDMLVAYVEKLWGLYSEVPKMTYLAVMDAHEPSLQAHILKSQLYSNFTYAIFY